MYILMAVCVSVCTHLCVRVRLFIRVCVFSQFLSASVFLSICAAVLICVTRRQKERVCERRERNRVCVCVRVFCCGHTHCAVEDLLSVSEPWQQLLFYVTRHRTEHTQISIQATLHERMWASSLCVRLCMCVCVFLHVCVCVFELACVWLAIAENI